MAEQKKRGRPPKTKSEEPAKTGLRVCECPSCGACVPRGLNRGMDGTTTRECRACGARWTA